jgi:DNA polymerase/3'-5' exonuclease PolX
MGDKIGVRAYSSAIATIAAYPYTFQTAQGKRLRLYHVHHYQHTQLTRKPTHVAEVARLPGCGNKIALLFQEYKDSGCGALREAREHEADPRLAVLRLFYDIWGVAETTARDFYNRGWRNLDDVVEYGWDALTRVQQIGVKYYDEFQLKIPRAEVERISETILAHANGIRNGFEMVIVGGYRRGKKESGDVDVVVSHPDEAATQGFVERIVVSLERAGYITHTLSLATTNSERGQVPVAWKGNEKKAGTGFDTLDKALVVWQDPVWPGMAKEEAAGGEANDNKNKKRQKNPNPHRRVDIIISPWKTAGCAVLGWTSGTTFQRDLRRYCKKERSLKFDSSGIRSRLDGSWVDFESGPDGSPAPDMLTAERRVFAGLGLSWRPPEERCTG